MKKNKALTLKTIKENLSKIKEDHSLREEFRLKAVYALEKTRGYRISINVISIIFLISCTLITILWLNFTEGVVLINTKSGVKNETLFVGSKNWSLESGIFHLIVPLIIFYLAYRLSLGLNKLLAKRAVWKIPINDQIHGEALVKFIHNPNIEHEEALKK